MSHTLIYACGIPPLSSMTFLTYGCVSLLVNRYNLKVLFHYIYTVFHKIIT